jgi:Mg/Co/Ni transporter MgtE
VIRALALGEVGVRDWWRVIRREIVSGLALGGILGTIGFLRIALWATFTNLYWPALVSRSVDGCGHSCRDCSLGNLDGLDVAADLTTIGI